MVELNKFYVGESAQWMKDNLENDYIDLTVTSPVYDNLRKYKGYSFNFEEIAKELFRVTKPGGVVVWVVGDATIKGSETCTSFKQAIYFKEVCGFNLHDTMVWEKTKPMPMDPRNMRYYQSFEFMFILTKGKCKTCNYIKIPCKHAGKKAVCYSRVQDGSLRLDRKEKTKNHIVNETKIKGNIWQYSNITNKDHPAIFPEKLAEDHILSWSNENDIVFDCFVGSGTTAKMAYLNNRKFIGVDMSEEYVNEICIPRLEMCGWEK